MPSRLTSLAQPFSDDSTSRRILKGGHQAEREKLQERIDEQSMASAGAQEEANRSKAPKHSYKELQSASNASALQAPVFR